LRAAGAEHFTVCRDVAGEFSSASAGAMTPGSVVEAGSAAKVVTVRRSAVLAGSGDLALSDPVGRYLPNLVRATTGRRAAIWVWPFGGQALAAVASSDY